MKDTNPNYPDAGGNTRLPWPDDSKVSAKFSDCGEYRYWLREVWDDSKSLVMWVLMNPSVACEKFRDPTLRRTGNFTRRWGYGGQVVVNVHAYRATDKKKLLAVTDPVGPKNDDTILQMARDAQLIVLAYGKPPGGLRKRNKHVEFLLQDHACLCHLKLSSDGTPSHPLRLKGDLKPQPHIALSRR